MLTEDQCKQYLADQTFHFQPPHYKWDHPHWPGMVGIETEMLPFYENRQKTPQNVPLFAQKGESPTLVSILLNMAAQRKDWQVNYMTVEEESLPYEVLLEHGDKLSFEPGGQLEFSSRPYACLSGVVERTNAIQKILDDELRKNNIKIMQIGFNPYHNAEQVGLQMRKPRYLAMNEYFNKIGPYGQEMMRLTCTVQVNLDFGASEETLVKRYLCSLLLAPFTATLFSFSAVKEGKLLNYPGYRSQVWRKIDNSRTGLPPLKKIIKEMSKGACVESYYQLVKNSQVVFVPQLDYFVSAEKFVTWDQWLTSGIQGVYPTAQDFQTQLSLIFPEVRPRGFMEIRSIDAQSRPWQFVPASFYTGILYDPTTLDQTLAYLLPLAGKIPSYLEKTPEGPSQKPFAEANRILFEMATTGLKRLPSCYRGDGIVQLMETFGEIFPFRQRCPGDDLGDLIRASEAQTFTQHIYQNLVDKWMRGQGVQKPNIENKKVG